MSASSDRPTTRTAKIFVIACFVIWAALSYLALFALAMVFWVAMLEAQFHPGAFIQYAAALVVTIVSAIASLWLWKRVHDRPWLYPRAARLFGIASAIGAVAALGALLA